MADTGLRRQRDSSRPRVKPVLDAISSAEEWLPRLLRLPKGAGAVPPGLDHTVLSSAWGDPEPRLPAPPSLLRWLVQNLDVAPRAGDASESARLRRLLLQRDAATIRRALAGLEQDCSRGNWWVLEGPSYPDAVVETPDAIVVIEGKRTERAPTTRTQWMRVRHQMLRHMDCAWERRAGQRVLGLFVVEEENDRLPPGWRTAAEDTVAAKVLAASLPHRTGEERARIAEGFLGIATWEAVCREFGLDTGRLPDTVADLPQRTGRPSTPVRMRRVRPT
jgi:hypothetical protein